MVVVAAAAAGGLVEEEEEEGGAEFLVDEEVVDVVAVRLEGVCDIDCRGGVGLGLGGLLYVVAARLDPRVVCTFCSMLVVASRRARLPLAWIGRRTEEIIRVMAVVVTAIVVKLCIIYKRRLDSLDAKVGGE